MKTNPKEIRSLVDSAGGRWTYVLAVACRCCLRAYPCLFTQRTSGDHTKIWVYSLRHLEAAIATSAMIASDKILTDELLEGEVDMLRRGCAAIADEYESQAKSGSFPLEAQAKIVRAISELISVAIEIHGLDHPDASKPVPDLAKRITNIVDLSNSRDLIGGEYGFDTRGNSDEDFFRKIEKTEKDRVEFLFDLPLWKDDSPVQTTQRLFSNIPMDDSEQGASRWMGKLIDRYLNRWWRSQGRKTQQSAIQSFRRSPDPDAIDLLFNLHVRYRREGDSKTFPQPLESILGEIPKPASSSNSESIGFGALSDQRAALDLFGFKPYVDAVSRFLRSDTTAFPLTMSIEGEWGTGKSSFMAQLEDSLSYGAEARRKKSIGGLFRDLTYGSSRSPEREKVLSVWFNPWRHDSSEALWAAFSQEFVEQLRMQLPPWKRIAAGIRLHLARIDWRVGLLPILWFLAKCGIWTFLLITSTVLIREGIDTVADKFAKGENFYELLIKGGGWSGIVGGILLAIHHFSKLLGNPLKTDLKKYFRTPDYAEKAAFIETFHADFSRIVSVYGQKKRILVFVDDLDRCEIPKAAELLQAINLMMATSDDYPMAFILGLDREKVAAGIAVKHEDALKFLPVGDENDDLAKKGLRFGFNFIEKFIQLPFRLPQIGDHGLDDFLNTLSMDGRLERDIDANPETTPAYGPEVEEDLSSEELAGIHDTTGMLEELVSDRERTEEKGAAESLGEEKKEEIEEKRSTFELETRGDSPLVRELAKAAAGFLDYNPRRLKKFLNLFRLQAYLCWELGLLLPIPKKVPGENASKMLPTVSLTQLAKLVGLSIKHPLFFEDLCKKPELLKEINWREALDEKDASIPKDPTLVGFLAVRPSGVGADEAAFNLIDLPSFLSMIPLPSKDSE